MGPTEIRWNGTDGPLIGTAMGPDFVTNIAIPEAPDGLYTVVVLSRDVDGGVATAATATVGVLVPGAPLVATTGTAEEARPNSSPRGRAAGNTLLLTGAAIGLVGLGFVMRPAIARLVRGPARNRRS